MKSSRLYSETCLQPRTFNIYRAWPPTVKWSLTFHKAILGQMSVARGAKNTLGFRFNIVLAAEGEIYLHVNSHRFDQWWTTWALSGTGDDTRVFYFFYNLPTIKTWSIQKNSPITYISGILETWKHKHYDYINSWVK